MKTLFVAWQQPVSREWIPVAKLEHTDGKFYFSYTRGVFRAKNFLPFSRMHQLDAVYESTSIFPLFANRLISKSRPEYSDFMRWLGLSNTEDDILSMLALTGGIRGTDSIELFQPPAISELGEYQVEFFARSLSHLPKEAIASISKLSPGEKLFLMKDCQNRFDDLAIAIRTDDPPSFIGFCPKYYTSDLGTLLSFTESNLQARVKCVNPDAPLNMRLLCTVTGFAPKNFSSLAEAEDFKKIEGSIPQEWQKVSDSLDNVLHNP